MPAQVISGPFIGPATQKSVVERIATRLYHSTRQPQLREEIEGRDMRKNPSTRAAATNTVTLVCISDTHNTFPAALPMGDILLHAGDLSQYGTFAEIQAQLKWLASQPHPHKVVISGNHDLLLDSKFVAAHPDRELDKHSGQRRTDLDWGGIHYLEHGSVDLLLQEKGRSIRIFGSPWTPKFGNFAFQYGDGDASSDAFSWADSVPKGTDILLVHGPPKGHLDHGGNGCGELLAEVWRARPKIVVCGHIHAGRGEERLVFDRSQANYERVVLGRGSWTDLALCFIWYSLKDCWALPQMAENPRQHLRIS